MQECIIDILTKIVFVYINYIYFFFFVKFTYIYIFSSSRHDQAAKDILDTEEFCEKHQDTPSNPDYPPEVRVYTLQVYLLELEVWG